MDLSGALLVLPTQPGMSYCPVFQLKSRFWPFYVERAFFFFKFSITFPTHSFSHAVYNLTSSTVLTFPDFYDNRSHSTFDLSTTTSSSSASVFDFQALRHFDHFLHIDFISSPGCAPHFVTIQGYLLFSLSVIGSIAPSPPSLCSLHNH